jgi:hypothetical protein
VGSGREDQSQQEPRRACAHGLETLDRAGQAVLGKDDLILRCRGVGIALLPSRLVRAPLNRGELIQVLT